MAETHVDGWACAACTFRNGAALTTCEMCGAGKPRSPVVVAAFSPDTPTKFDPKVLLRHARWLNNVPFLSPDLALPTVVARLIELNADDFTWAADFSPSFLADLMRHGFLTMATEAGPGGLVALLPKLHKQRCVLHFDTMKVQRGTRKKAKRFELSCNTAFDAVVSGLRDQHGPACWLYPPLCKGLKALLDRPGCCDAPGQAAVRSHCFEVWDVVSGELAAGELGYSVGPVYCSLSGFSRVDGAGSAQMAAVGALLASAGCPLWDLGMAMPYKEAMGGSNLPRAAFVKVLVRARAEAAAAAAKAAKAAASKAAEDPGGGGSGVEGATGGAAATTGPAQAPDSRGPAVLDFAALTAGKRVNVDAVLKAAPLGFGSPVTSAAGGGGSATGIASAAPPRSAAAAAAAGGGAGKSAPRACAQCGAVEGPAPASGQGARSAGAAVAAACSKFAACARCKAVAYCGKACQRAHWAAGHKLACGAPSPSGPQPAPAAVANAGRND